MPLSVESYLEEKSIDLSRLADVIESHDSTTRFETAFRLPHSALPKHATLLLVRAHHFKLF